MKHSHAEIEMMAVPVRFADFVEIKGSGEGDERVVVNFDEAFRYGIGMIQRGFDDRVRQRGFDDPYHASLGRHHKCWTRLR